MAKVTIIGSGNVGASAALYIAEKRIADVVLIDIAEGLAYGRAMDAIEAAPLRKYDTWINGTVDFSKMIDSDVVPQCEMCKAEVTLKDYSHIKLMAGSALLPSAMGGSEWYLLATDNSGGDVRVRKPTPSIDAMFRGLKAITTLMAGEGAFREFQERAEGHAIAAKLFFCDKCTQELGGTRAQAGALFLEKMAF